MPNPTTAKIGEAAASAGTGRQQERQSEIPLVQTVFSPLTTALKLASPEIVPSQGVARKIGMRPVTGLVQHGGFEHIIFSTTLDGTLQ